MTGDRLFRYASFPSEIANMSGRTCFVTLWHPFSDILQKSETVAYSLQKGMVVQNNGCRLWKVTLTKVSSSMIRCVKEIGPDETNWLATHGCFRNGIYVYDIFSMPEGSSMQFAHSPLVKF